MANPVSTILAQCPTGFTLGKKLKITVCILLYLISPIDCIPEFLMPFGIMDDLFAVFLLLRVWFSPTQYGHSD